MADDASVKSPIEAIPSREGGISGLASASSTNRKLRRDTFSNGTASSRSCTQAGYASGIVPQGVV
jgi:hypothetical protein